MIFDSHGGRRFLLAFQLMEAVVMHDLFLLEKNASDQELHDSLFDIYNVNCTTSHVTLVTEFFLILMHDPYLYNH